MRAHIKRMHPRHEDAVMTPPQQAEIFPAEIESKDVLMADNTDVRERLLPDLPGEQEVRAPVGNVEPPRIDVIIGHRLGSGGSVEYEVQLVGGAVVWRPEASVISPPDRVLLRRYQLENQLLHIDPREALFQNGDPLREHFLEWERFGANAQPVPTYPSCKLLFESSKMSCSDGSVGPCVCCPTAQAQLPFASLGGCAAGFLICLDKLLGGKRLGGEPIKAAGTVL